MSTYFLWGGLTLIEAFPLLSFLSFGIPWELLGAIIMFVGFVLLLLKK